RSRAWSSVRARTGRRDGRPARRSTLGRRCGLGAHAEIVCTAEDGLGLVSAAALTQEVRPLEGGFPGVDSARVHGEEIHCATVRLVRTSLVSFHREPPREGSHGVALLLAVEVSEQSERVACPLDREVRVAFERREMRLAGPEHSEILCAWLGAEQSLGLLEVA